MSSAQLPVKIYVEPHAQLSRAMDRVVHALKSFAPSSFYVTNTKAEADVVVLHVIGYPETLEAIRWCRETGKRYAMIQYCLRSTQQPMTNEWLPLWQGAEVVWSYYDLYAAISEDYEHDAAPLKQSFNFYRSPLGVDTTVFRAWPSVPKKYSILTSGYVAVSETVSEAVEATRRLGHPMFHLGPDDVAKGDHVTSKIGINDPQLAQIYSACKYVAGLRRGEGFELPAAEGLICGARPICYDRPHYRDWFGDSAVYIPEANADLVTDYLCEVLAEEPKPVTEEEIAIAKRLFDWDSIVTNFYAHLEKGAPRVPKRSTVLSFGEGQPVLLHASESVISLGEVSDIGTRIDNNELQKIYQNVDTLVGPRKMKPNVLWVGDAGVSSGFARCTHRIVDSIRSDYEVHVLGLNYMGDPHPYPFPIYPCYTWDGGDPFGVTRLPKLIQKLAPTLIVIQNDPWNMASYLRVTGEVPVVGVLAVDGYNCARAKDLNALKCAVFWTQFGRQQAVKGGFSGDAAVIPLGVDLNVYRPRDKFRARTTLGLGRATDENVFIVGNVNRNQPRKRLDLSIAWFAEWVKTRRIADAYLYLHVGPTGDAGYDLRQLAQFYGIENRIIHADPEIGLGVAEEALALTYATFDVQINTGQGEGWGLTTMEGMACGVPQIVGDWAALGEWTEDVVIKIPCTSIETTPNGINVIGGIPDKERFITALDNVYRSRDLRQKYSEVGLGLVSRVDYRWETIGETWRFMLEEMLETNPAFV